MKLFIGQEMLKQLLKDSNYKTSELFLLAINTFCNIFSHFFYESEKFNTHSNG